MAKNCINQKCEKEIPTNATFCSFCGTQQVENEKLTEEEKMRKELNEMQETIRVLKKALADAQKNSAPTATKQSEIKSLQSQLTDAVNKNQALQSSVKTTTPPKAETKPKTYPTNSTKSFPTAILIVGIVLLIAVGGVTGYFLFLKTYLFERDANRYYPVVNTFLRSTRQAGVEFNKLGTAPYGAELIMYDKGSDWSEIKWKNTQNGKIIKGYISTAFILSQSDFQILNEIWGDNESKEIIETSKCRIALLNYFKEKGYAGSWKVFSKSKDTKPNSTYFERVIDKNSKFTDFAVIIKNISTGNRKCLLFRFDDDEKPHFVYEEDAPATGDIASIRSYSPKSFYITYRQ